MTPPHGLTRIAPTPSGFLHAGNVATFRSTAQLAEELHLGLALRIDDADAARYRREYAEDIFRVLHLLNINWQVGPRTIEDFEGDWSQRNRTEFYRSEINRLRSTEVEAEVEVYACACSRRDLTGVAHGGCPGQCRERDLDLLPHATSLRVHVPVGTHVTMGDTVIDLAEAIGDAVLWRRDDLPAYHLVTILEDRELGTTHIVRGMDLVASSAFQVWLAPHLAAPSVAAAHYVHLPLLLGPDGTKLSKSQLGDSARPWTLDP